MAFEVSSVPLSLTTISGVAPQFGDTIQLTCDPQTGERGVDHQGQAFSGEVIDQREDAEAPSAHQRVRHEVERPTQIRGPGEPPSAPVYREPVCGHRACAPISLSSL